jgi:hypothetical protein
MTMIADNRQPVSDHHIAFGRAIVALAREHGFSHLRVQFWGDDRVGWDAITMDWASGRHGIKNHLTFKAEATYRCDEIADAITRGDHRND